MTWQSKFRIQRRVSKVGDYTLSIMLFADDIILTAENESDLQNSLDILHRWCQSWNMKINAEKTKIIHFRGPSKTPTDAIFRCGREILSRTDKYKYLGLWLTEHLDLNYMAKEVAKAAHRALGLLTAKSKAYGGMPYKVYTHLYNSLVVPIITYGAAIWGQRDHSCINSVHNRACRFFLGVGKRTLNAAVQGDMGWPLPWNLQWHCTIKLCCRLTCMEHTRVHHKIFKWACENKNKKNWIFPRTLDLEGRTAFPPTQASNDIQASSANDSLCRTKARLVKSSSSIDH